MDEYYLCPPWWPDILWALHHLKPPPPPNGDPPIDWEHLFKASQQVLLGLQAFHVANTVEGSVRGALRESALGQIATGVKMLSGLAERGD
jgi:hypothetical protein